MSLKRLISLCLLLTVLSTEVTNGKDRQNVSKKYKLYVGKTLHKFLNDFEGEVVTKYYIDEPPGKLIGVQIQLKDQTSVLIYFKRIKHVSQLNKERNWDWVKIRKEKIASIRVL